MPSLIPQLMSRPGVPRAKHEDMFCHLSSFATAAEGGKHRADSGLEEKSFKAISSHSQLDSQRALCQPEPIMELQDFTPWEGFNHIGVQRALG